MSSFGLHRFTSQLHQSLVLILEAKSCQPNWLSRRSQARNTRKTYDGTAFVNPGTVQVHDDAGDDDDELEGDIMKEVNQSDFRFQDFEKYNAILENELEEATVTEPKHINSRKENDIAFGNS